MRGGFREPLHFSSTSLTLLACAAHNVYVVCNTLYVVFANVNMKNVVKCKLMQ